MMKRRCISSHAKLAPLHKTIMDQGPEMKRRQTESHFVGFKFITSPDGNYN